MRLEQLQPLQVGVDLGVMTMRGYSTYAIASELEIYH